MAEELTLDLALDGVLAVMLPLIAWRVLATPDLRKAIVLFIALGLTSALAWARLAAPDIALVEAAVGTGVTGALLMSCLPWAGAAGPRARPRGHARHLALVPVGAVIACLAWAVLALPEPGAGLVGEVEAELAQSGVSHPVTAVLLNYRGYDTLLEIVVLVAAAVAIDAVLPAPVATALQPSAPRARTLVGSLARLLVPGFVLVAGYLVWKGSHAPGGAFQAGAVLAAGGVLLLFARRLRPLPLRSPAVRALLLSGLVVFVAVAIGPVLAGLRLLEYPLDWAGTLILVVECALVVTIALALVMFFPSGVMETSVRPTRESAP